MTDAELRDMAMGAAMAAMQPSSPVLDMLVYQAEMAGLPVNAGHHGYSEVVPGGSPPPGCFEIRAAKTNGDSDAGGFDNPYYMVGSRIYAAANLSSYGNVVAADSRKNKIFALKIDLTGSSPSASIKEASSFSELQAEANENGIAIYPLYEFGPSGNVKCDLRNVPTMVAKEWMA